MIVEAYRKLSSGGAGRLTSSVPDCLNSDADFDTSENGLLGVSPPAWRRARQTPPATVKIVSSVPDIAEMAAVDAAPAVLRRRAVLLRQYVSHDDHQRPSRRVCPPVRGPPRRTLPALAQVVPHGVFVPPSAVLRGGRRLHWRMSPPTADMPEVVAVVFKTVVPATSPPPRRHSPTTIAVAPCGFQPVGGRPAAVVSRDGCGHLSRCLSRQWSPPLQSASDADVPHDSLSAANIPKVVAVIPTVVVLPLDPGRSPCAGRPRADRARRHDARPPRCDRPPRRSRSRPAAFVPSSKQTSSAAASSRWSW